MAAAAVSDGAHVMVLTARSARAVAASASRWAARIRAARLDACNVGSMWVWNRVVARARAVNTERQPAATFTDLPTHREGSGFFNWDHLSPNTLERDTMPRSEADQNTLEDDKKAHLKAHQSRIKSKPKEHQSTPKYYLAYHSKNHSLYQNTPKRAPMPHSKPHPNNTAHFVAGAKMTLNCVPKAHQNRTKTTPKAHQRHTKTAPKLHQRHTKATPKPHQTTPKPHQRHTKGTPKAHQTTPKRITPHRHLAPAPRVRTDLH
jgi:hypothetical protein